MTDYSPPQQSQDSPKPLKVLHIGKYFPPYAGGMETYLRDLMVAQCHQGLKTIALVHQSELSLKSQAESYEAREQRIDITRSAVWARLLFTPISPTFPLQLHRLIRREQPDLLHLHMPNVSAFWALLLPSTRKIPWVIHWHSDVLASEHSLGLRLFYGIYRPFERAMLKHSRVIIATSEPYLESSEPLQFFRDKCQVVPLGLDPENLEKPSAVIEREVPSNLRILAIGRLTYYKGFEYLVRAVARLEGLELHLVGIGELEDKLKNLAAELNAGKKITFHGKLPGNALAAQYRACDCLCLSSIERTEAFGMVLLEAMCQSKATIASKVAGSGMGWVVESGVTGLLTAPEDVESLVKALADLRDNRDKVQVLGNNGRSRFLDLFHIRRSEEAISLLYNPLVSDTTTEIQI